MVNLKFNYKIGHKLFILTIDHGANSRVSVAMVKFLVQNLRFQKSASYPFYPALFSNLLETGNNLVHCMTERIFNERR